MIQKIIQLDKAIEFQYSRVLKHAGSDNKFLLDMLNEYLNEYLNLYEFSCNEALEKYCIFVNRYIGDLKIFEETGLYPYQNKTSELILKE